METSHSYARLFQPLEKEIYNILLLAPSVFQTLAYFNVKADPSSYVLPNGHFQMLSSLCLELGFPLDC